MKLLSSMGPREIVEELARAYFREHGQPIITEAAGGVEVAKRVQADEAVDIVVLASNAIDKLIANGKLLAESRTDLMKCGIAVAVRQGAPVVDIGSEEAVKRAVLAARTLGYSTGPSGVYLEQLFEGWGIMPEIKSRIVVPPPGVPVGSLIAKGEVELGFQQRSELITLSGITVLGPLPPPIQTITTFTGAVARHCQLPGVARRVLEFMAAPNVREIMQRYGME